MNCEYCNHEHTPDPFFCIARLQEDHEAVVKEKDDIIKSSAEYCKNCPQIAALKGRVIELKSELYCEFCGNKKDLCGNCTPKITPLKEQIAALKAEKEIILDAGTSESNLVVHLQAENQRQTEEIKRLREEIKRVVGVMTGTVFYGGLPQDAMLKIAQDALKQEEVKE